MDSGDRDYTVNLYDINYRTWDVRCIWQGRQLSAFGVMGDSIFCKSPDGWLLIDAASGKIDPKIPFVPLYTDGGYWLVRKPGEAAGCWSYDRGKRLYVAHFELVDRAAVGFGGQKLSPDGKNRAWVLASPPRGWRGGRLAGRLILQRDGAKEDVSVPIELDAHPGSAFPVIPDDIHLSFSSKGKFLFRAQLGNGVAKDRVWTIDIATGKVSSDTAPHGEPAEDARDILGGVPVPDYLRRDVRDFGHFGRSGLAPAFLLNLGILKEKPGYADCIAGVSRNGAPCAVLRFIKVPWQGFLFTAICSPSRPSVGNCRMRSADATSWSSFGWKRLQTPGRARHLIAAGSSFSSANCSRCRCGR